MATWIDVADSAVKIGLGAFLGGMFTLMTAHLSHKKDGQKAFRAGAREALEAATREIEAILFAARIAFVSEARFIDDSLHGDGLDEREAWERIKRLEEQLVEWRAKLSSIEGSLLLYGCTSSTTTIKAIADCIAEVPDRISPYAVIYEKKHFPPKREIEITIETINVLRKRLYEELSQEMKNV